jgi:hypothetical protein
MTPQNFPRFACLACLGVSAAAVAESLILIPDSGRDRICAFSALDGSIVNLEFIPKDGRMKQVVQVVQTPWNTLLMSDFEANSVWEYGLDGTFIGTFVSTASLGFPVAPGASRGLQGICIAYGKVWLSLNDVSGTGSDNRNAIWSVEFDGSGLQQCVTAVSQPALGQVRGIAPYNGGLLVADSGDPEFDDIEFVSIDGNSGTVVSPTWHDSEVGVSYMKFPQQVTPLANGNVLVAAFSSGAIFEIDGVTRNLSNLAYPAQATSFRGVHPLDNGEWLATAGTKVLSLAPIGGQTTEIVNVLSGGGNAAGSFRWVSRVEIPECFGDIDGSQEVDQGDVAFALLDFGPCPGCAADLDGSGEVDFGDVALILLANGPCS